MKRLLLIILVIILFPAASYASTKEDPVWTKGLYDETNYLTYWHCDNLELRIPSYCYAEADDNVFGFAAGFEKNNETIAFFVYFQHYKENSKAGQTLRKYEKKNGINQTLIYILKSQLPSNQADETLIHCLAGTPEGTVVYWTPQVMSDDTTESYESYAVIWADDHYQVISSRANNPDLSKEGLYTCLGWLFYRGKRVYYDNLSDEIQYSNGIETEINITNPLRKAVSSSITIADHLEGSSLTDWQVCDIPEYKISFYCPPGVFMLSANSADEEWAKVLDIPAYKTRVKEAQKMVSSFTEPEENKQLEALRQYLKDELESSIESYMSTTMQTKRSYEDGSCLDISPYTVVYIAPEYSEGWHLTIDICEERDYPKGTEATNDNLKKCLTDEIKEEDCYNRINYDYGITNIGSQLFAYIYNTSSYVNHYIYLTYHDGRKIQLTLSITKPEYAEHMELLPFMEDIIKRIKLY